MKFPELPTDNLYKFMALFGITLLISSYFPLFQTYKLMVDSARLGGEIAILEKEIESVTSSINNWTKEKGSEYIEIQHKGLVSLVELSNKKLELTTIECIRYTYQSAFFFSSISSAFLIAFGFKLWYKKLQKPRDIILEEKVKKIIQKNVK